MNTPNNKNRRQFKNLPWRRDLNAGLCVAVIAIPQSIAYAMIAQVPAEYGIYTLIIHAALGTLLNHNPLMSVGPTNTQSLLVASVLIHVIAKEGIADPVARGELYLQLAISLSFLKGVVQFVLAGLRLGVLARYFSRSVILGFTAGAGALIAIGQLPAFLGLDLPANYGSLPAALAISAHVITRIADISAPAVLLAFLSIGILVACSRKSKLLPGALIALLATATLNYLLGWTTDVVPCVTWSGIALPRFSLPQFDLRTIEVLLGGAFALSVLGMVETYSVSKLITGYAPGGSRPNREMVAQGAIHFIGSFLGCIPGSGSFARSAMNVYAGAATRYAGLVCACAVAATFLVASPCISYLPLATFAGQLIVMGYALCNWKGIRQILRANMVDGSVLIFTFMATLLLPLHYAIFAGVLLNLALYIRNVSRLDIAELVPADPHSFSERSMRSPREMSSRDVIVLQLHGDLFFGLVDDLAQYFDQLSQSDVQVVLIRLKATRSIDTTVMHRMAAFDKQLKARGGCLLCCGIAPALKVRFDRFGLTRQLGDENIFEAAENVYEGARAALGRADSILERRGDEDSLTS